MEVLEMAPSTNRITLRLPNNVLTELKKEAEKKDLPLNALVTKILNKNVSFDMYLEAIQGIIMSHTMLLKIIDQVDERAMKEIAREDPQVMKDMLAVLGLRYDLDHIINDYLVMLGKYCGWYKFSHEITHNHYRLVFETGYGSKWIKFIAEYVKNIFESLKIRIDNESISNKVIVFEFTKR
jgi:hypothetical protein